MKRQILSTIFSSILSLFLAIVLLGGGLCFYAEETVCDPQPLIQDSMTAQYAQELYEQIKYDWENYLAITGVVDNTTIMTVLTQENIQKDVVSYIKNSYTGTSKVDTSELRSQLDTKVREYISDITGKAEPDEELEANINELINACMQTYERSITIPMLPKILGTVGKFQKYLVPARLIAFGFGLVIAVIIFFLQRKRRNLFYYTGIATATNALLILGATGLAEHYSLINRLPIEESALRTLLISYLQFLLDKLQIVGFVFLAATAFALLMYLLFACIAKLKSRKLVCE